MQVITTEKIPIKMWLENIEDGALQQAKNLANLPFAYKWIALAPDCHSGYGMPIGGIMATQGVIIPNAVGVDIGCGMIAVKTNIEEISRPILESIVQKIHEVIPVGFHHQSENQEWIGFDEVPNIPILQEQLESARKQLGTLGAGNHYQEVQKGDDGFIWLMIHSGSRNLGLKVANVYQKKAQELCQRWYSDIPDKDLAFLPIETPEGKEYYEAMNFCLKFAQANRDLMMKNMSSIVNDFTGGKIVETINIHHNYAAFEHHYGKNVIVHRKGATKAALGQLGIIPGSMGTSSYIVEGLGNPESFYSCSHGAGRAMGRKEAIRTLNFEEEQHKMDGIVHGMASAENLDEAPGSYKNIDEVMKNQEDLVKIVVKLTPLANVKG